MKIDCNNFLKNIDGYPVEEHKACGLLLRFRLMQVVTILAALGAIALTVDLSLVGAVPVSGLNVETMTKEEIVGLAWAIMLAAAEIMCTSENRRDDQRSKCTLYRHTKLPGRELRCTRAQKQIARRKCLTKRASSKSNAAPNNVLVYQKI